MVSKDIQQHSAVIKVSKNNYPRLLSLKKTFIPNLINLNSSGKTVRVENPKGSFSRTHPTFKEDPFRKEEETPRVNKSR